eukprot:TRINITY_DN2383_c0_g2_i1.p1 TRINITY_DN2383_c0_g2~~TRINITY_DN2383_c0_g2_i1.p1  ORF type:complete len:415 (+),score=88.48 TRINITY_DN2383_c0_g2_i1:95-1339(+)
MWCPGKSKDVAAPKRTRKGRKAIFVSLAALGAVAFSVSWAISAEEEEETAFVTGVSANRLAGHTIVVEELPRGLTCRQGGRTTKGRVRGTGGKRMEGSIYGAGHMYARKAEVLQSLYDDEKFTSAQRPEWLPYQGWKGEQLWHPSKMLQDDRNRPWFHFNAEGKTLGHFAREVSMCLRGKHNPLIDPVGDVGSFVVVTNCERIKVSGKKYHYKLYLRNLSNRPGHTKVERFKDLIRRFPERIIMKAVWGQMPRTPTSRRIFKERLKLFAGPNHLYTDQDVVEYPFMHKIKDCTVESNIRRRNRLRHMLTKEAPRAKIVMEFDEQKKKMARLRQFKYFLKKHMTESGEDSEALERMKMDELVAAAEKKRLDDVFEESKDVKPTPPRRTIWWRRATGPVLIKRKRISNNKKALGQR